MKTFLFAGIATTLMVSAAPLNASDSVASITSLGSVEAFQSVAHGRKNVRAMSPGAGKFKRDMGPGVHVPKPGRHHAGFRPRPGFHGIPHTDVYRRPHRGFILPRYWVQPTFYLNNFGSYGLTAPSNGYYWSRYYDDAVLTDNRGYVQDYRSGIDWDASYDDGGPDRTDDYREPDYAPSMRPDANAYDWNDDVAFAAPDGSSYSYDGDWNGEYVDPEGRVFEGDWSGTVTRRDGNPGPGFPSGRADVGYTGPPERVYSDHYRAPREYEHYERCLKSNGITGAAIGAIIGGVAGNRIAGRGDRLGGSLLGAGLGGLTGLAIEKATSSCKKHHPHHRGSSDNYYPAQRYPQGYPERYPHHNGVQSGWQGGYYYYPQAPMVTVTVVPGATTTTTTVTEETYYETVKTHPRKKVVRKWKPKPKPRCICR